MKRLIFMLMFPFVLGCSQQQQIQETPGKEEMASLIENQKYTFTVRTVLPARGRIIQVNSQYDLRVKKDSLISFLPYFGRAYSAPIGTTGGGFQFTSTDFSHTKEAKKNGSWLITIKPNDYRDVQQMFLTVSEGGSATLQVTSNSRQPISYNGYIGK